MGVVAKEIPRGCQGLSTPVSLGYPLSVFNKNSTLTKECWSVGCAQAPYRLASR